MTDQIPAKDRKAIWRRSWSCYDILSGDDEAGQYWECKGFPERGDILDSFIRSKRQAMQTLRECQKEYPAAYLVKIVRTRYKD